MKKLFSLGLLAMLIFGMVQASHLTGGDVSMECINSCTVRVHASIYRHCSGSALYTIGVNWHAAAPGCVLPPAINNWSPFVTEELVPICPTSQTDCTMPGAAIHGIEQTQFYRDFDICAVAPCLYDITWNECCRNPTVTALTNPGSTAYYASTRVNTAVTPCNNTPRFFDQTFVFVPAGQPSQLAMGAYDPDGDSLSFELGPSLYDSAQAVNYASGYSPTAPFGPSWAVTVDSHTGVIQLNPTPGNIVVGQIAMYVKEYRQGVLIGQNMRDLLVNVISSPSNQSPTIGSVTNLSSSASLVGNEIFVCNPGPICFDLTGSDANSGQDLKLSWTNLLPGASFTEVGNSSVHDTILGSSNVPPAGRFCWTPTANGDYYVRFRLQDNACPVYGFSERIVAIHVGHGPIQATATPGPCPSVQFATTGCGVGPFTYAWSGAGGFSSSLQNPSYAYPSVGSYPWQVIVSDGTVSDTLRDTVVVGGPAVHQSILGNGHVVMPCFGAAYDTLDGGSFASYLWSTGATTPQLPVALAGTYSVTTTAASGCQYYDSTVVQSLPADIAGHAFTSLGGPLQNQKIYLISMDTILQALFAIDSIQTDSSGYFYFCNVNDTIVLLKAAPNAGDYPNEMPTYADTSLTWANAIQFLPLTQAPILHDFATLAGVNPGGPGFIGGLISQGANKVGAIGDPVVGLRVFLRDRVTGAVIGYRNSDVNGYVSFANIPLGDYDLIPDRYGVSVTNVPHIMLTAQASVQDSLDLQLHSTWLELVTHTTAIFAQTTGFELRMAPNPFSGLTHCELLLHENATVQIQLLDALGRSVEQLDLGILGQGLHLQDVGAQLPAGLYFVQIRVNEKLHVMRVVKE